MKPKSLVDSASFLRRLVLVLIALVIFAYAVARIGIDFGKHLRVVNEAPASGLAGVLATDVTMLLFIAALIQVVTLLRRLQSGELFTPGVTRAFRGFAFWLMLAALAAIIGPTVARMTESASSGHLQLTFEFDLREVLFFVAAAIILLIARVLDEAARIDAELREIV